MNESTISAVARVTQKYETGIIAVQMNCSGLITQQENLLLSYETCDD